MKRFLLLTVAAAASILVSACSQTQACTEIGCYDAVTFQVTGLVTKYRTSFPLVVHLCVNDICTTADLALDASGAATCTPASGAPIDTCTVQGDTLTASYMIAVEETAMSSVKIDDGSGAKLFEETRTVSTSVTYPNGEDCPPACVQGTVTYTP